MKKLLTIIAILIIAGCAGDTGLNTTQDWYDTDFVNDPDVIADGFINMSE